MFSSSSMCVPGVSPDFTPGPAFGAGSASDSVSGVIPAFSLLLPLLFLLFFASATLPALAAEATLPEVQNLVRQKKYEQALEKVDAYLAPRPRDAQGRFVKGLILTELNRPGDAIDIFSQLTRDYPTLPEPYNNLAVLYAQQKQYDKARIALEMAIKTHPSYATAHENLGDVYARLASQAYNKALQLDAGNTAAQNKLALIHDLMDTSGKDGMENGGSAPMVLAAAPQAAPAPTAARPPPAKIPSPPLPSSPPLPPPSSALPSPVPAANATSPANPPNSKIPPGAAATPAAVPGNIAGAAAPSAAKTPAAQTAAASVVPPPPAPAKQNNPETELIQATQRWAGAWSKKDVKAYLALYAPDFLTPGGTARKEWEAERTRRIDKPGKIEVTLSNLQVSVYGDKNGDKARVKFRQRYKSATLASSTGKTLIFIRNGNQWLIQEERVD